MSDREADGKVGGQFLDELFSALEDLETQSAGVVQFLKDKGLATDEELAPYLEAAASRERGAMARCTASNGCIARCSGQRGGRRVRAKD